MWSRSSVAIENRQLHQRQVQGFLEKHFHLTGWQFALPHGWGKESYFASAREQTYFVKLGVNAAVYKGMATLGITPQVLAAGQLEDGVSILVQPFIAGQNPSRKDYHTHLEQAAALIHRLHHSSEIQRLLPAAPSDHHREVGMKTLERIQQKWVHYKAQVPETVAYVDDSLATLCQHIQGFTSQGLVASHNDICNANWLVTTDGRLYLIDFDSMSLDDPALDLGALLWWYYPPEMRPRFLGLAGYAGDETFRLRMQVRMALHCLDIALPRAHSFDTFSPHAFAGWLVDFKALMAGRENPQGYG